MRVHLNIKKEFGDTLFLRTEGTNKPWFYNCKRFGC
jgi:hypothetical protein